VTILPIVLTDDGDLRLGLIILVLFLTLISFVIRLRDWSPVKKIGKFFKLVLILIVSLFALSTFALLFPVLNDYFYPSPEKIERMLEDREKQERERILAAEEEKKKEEAEERERILAAEIEKLNEELEERRKRAEEIEERKKGFHCLSGWDGSHGAIKSYVIENMADPDSFEHISTKIGPVNLSGKHYLTMTYRGKNMFGGMVVNDISATIENSDCSASIN